MYDNFQPFEQVENPEFTFKPKRYEVWQNGSKIKHGNITGTITSKKTGIDSSSTLSLFHDMDTLADELNRENEFDKTITQSDRLQVIRIPSSSNGDENVGLSTLKMFFGETYGPMKFSSSHPFCCNIFLKNQRVSKVTFSYSSPEKLIEFYQD